MVCPKCGEKNEKGAKFCNKCGAKLEKKEEKVISEEQKKKDNKLAIIIVSVIVGLFLLSIIAYFVFTFLVGMFAIRTVEKGVNEAWKNISELEKDEKVKDLEKDIKKGIEDILEDQLDDDDDEEAVTEGELAVKKDGKVAVYFFRGQGCSHCAEAEEYFKSLEEEYGSKFTVIDYEVWYNSDNSAFMDKVAKERGETVQGVPYIIIGDKSWNGFTQSYGEEMLNKIKELAD